MPLLQPPSQPPAPRRQFQQQSASIATRLIRLLERELQDAASTPASSHCRTRCATAARVLFTLFQFLAPVEVVRVSDLVCNEWRVLLACSSSLAVQDDDLLWRALVNKWYRHTPFEPATVVMATTTGTGVTHSSSDRDTPTPHAARCSLSSSWKDLFVALSRRQPQQGVTSVSDLELVLAPAPAVSLSSSKNHIVPIVYQPIKSRIRITMDQRNFHLLLDHQHYMADQDDVYLSERVQELHVTKRNPSSPTAKEKLVEARRRLSALTLGKDQAPKPPACFRLTLTQCEVIVESSLMNTQLCKVALMDIIDITKEKLNNTGSGFVLKMSWEYIKVGLSTVDGADAWIAAISFNRARLEQLRADGAGMPKRQRRPSHFKALTKKLESLRRPTLLSHSHYGSFSSFFSSEKKPRPQLAPKPEQTTSTSSTKILSSSTTLTTRQAHRCRSFEPFSSTASPFAASMTVLTSGQSTGGGFSPPRFLLRTHRKLSQRFNLKSVEAKHGQRRRERSSSSSYSSGPSTTSESSRLSQHESVELSASQRGNSLSNCSQRSSNNNNQSARSSLSRSSSILACPMTPKELDHVRVIVYRALNDEERFEGQVCKRFFLRQEEFRVATPAMCAYYLAQVRDCMQSLQQFMLAYRYLELDLSLNDDDNATASEDLAIAVQHAVEEYFCFSIQYHLFKWARIASDTQHGRFRRAIGRWSKLRASSREFGLASHQQWLNECALVQHAIERFRAVGVEKTPTKKLTALIDAVQFLSDGLAFRTTAPPATRPRQTTQSQRNETVKTDADSVGPEEDDRVGNGDTSQQPPQRVGGAADALLPVFIYCLCKSKMREPWTNLVLMRSLCPFATNHGQVAYYLTMLEASLEYVRTFQ